jgi:NAD(P)H-hydrate repair Nnr-like enzyme with NAD(P)H-hydrate epimerase domain
LVDEASISVTASYIASRKTERGFTVYPNPTVDGRFMVQVNNRAFANRTYIIYSVSGQIITQGVLRLGNNAINIVGAAGSYIVAVDTPQGLRTERILKLQ